MSIKDEPFYDSLKKWEEEKNWREILGNVLAILNRDGGHYQSRHGVAAAVAEGIDMHYEILHRMDQVNWLLSQHLDNAAGDSSWVKEALEILEGKK